MVRSRSPEQRRDRDRDRERRSGRGRGSRSRSPGARPRDRRRSRSPARRRSRSRSPAGGRRREGRRSDRRSKSPPPPRADDSAVTSTKPKAPRHDDAMDATISAALAHAKEISKEGAPAMAVTVEEDEAEAMAKLMGFSSLTSTKGKKVEGNLDPTLNVNKKRRRYRQYMNRKGGFNRLLANQQ